MPIVKLNFSYGMLEVEALVYLGDTSATGDDPDVVMELETGLPDGPSVRLERILEEKAIEEAYKHIG